MIPLLALFAAGLLIYGLVEVWNGRWRALWTASGLAIALALICFTAEQWFPIIGANRGDGFILIGYIWVGLAVLGAAAAALLIAIPLHLVRKRTAPNLPEGTA